MNRPDDALDAAFASWLEAAADAPVPPERRERALAAIATRRPRPAPLAGLGSHWISEPSRVTELLTARGGAIPATGSLAAIILVVIAIALIGVALVVGSRDPQPQPLSERERLVYELGGEVYLAGPDGSDPQSVGAGDLVAGSIWAPDGLHFQFLVPGSSGTVATISDPDGRVVGRFDNAPGFNGYPVWSPDSTRLQAWTHGATRVSVYGLDGSLQRELELPADYSRFREDLGAWAPDGRAVWVLIGRGQVYPCTSGSNPSTPDTDPPPCAVPEAWELPIDGSTPRRLADDLALIKFELGMAAHDDRVAYFGMRTGPDDTRLYGAALFVAPVDGTTGQPVVREDDAGMGGQGMLPAWSPDGAQVAYVAWAPGEDGLVDLNVVDVATGTARTLAAGFGGVDGRPFSWSRDGKRILFAARDGARPDGLWTVGVDGGEPAPLVEGSQAGEWQPGPVGR